MKLLHVVEMFLTSIQPHSLSILVPVFVAFAASARCLELQPHVQIDFVQFLQECLSIRHRIVVCHLFGLVGTNIVRALDHRFVQCVFHRIAAIRYGPV